MMANVFSSTRNRSAAVRTARIASRPCGGSSLFRSRASLSRAASAAGAKRGSIGAIPSWSCFPAQFSALVPFRLSLALSFAAFPIPFVLFSALWIVAFEILLLVGAIDILLGIIPDELNLALLVLGFFAIIFSAENFGPGNLSFLGSAAGVLGLQSNIWIGHLIGAAFGIAFFGGIVLATRGKGMGMGDVKLALPLGLLFGWPDIFVITILSFVIGAVFGVGLIAFDKKSMKSANPFGPFLVVAAAIVFFFGSLLFDAYFRMTGL